MARAISPYYLDEYNNIVDSTSISDINLTVNDIKNLTLIDGLVQTIGINLNDLPSIKEQVKNKGAQYAPIVDSLHNVKIGLEAEIAKRFFDLVRNKPEHFIFPYLKWEDFKDVHHNTSLFNEGHCKLINAAENKHIRTLATISKKLGLPKLGGHTPRHTFANHLQEMDFSVSEIQGLLVHNNPRTTMIYLQNRQPNKKAYNSLKSFHAMLNNRQVS